MKIAAVITLAMASLVSGCVSDRMIDKIPLASFDTFEYHRAGNMTSADIVAEGASISDGTMTIKSMSIKEDWGPVVNFYIKIDGYKRAVEEQLSK